MSKSLNEMTAEELGMLFPIILTDPQNDWKFEYEKEKQIIEEILGETLLRIEHIGSTAIHGIKAKPTIDILVEIKDTSDTAVVINSFKNAGYEYSEKPENPAPHMMFMKGYSRTGFVGQAVHIHVRYFGDWDEIVFRDYLNTHFSTAKEYEMLKLDLQKTYKNNRENYTNGKTEFVKRVVTFARRQLNFNL